MGPRSTLVRDPFQELVKRDAFGDTTPEEAAALRADDQIERFQVELTRTYQSIVAQLTKHNDGLDVRDDDWSRRASGVKAAYAKRLAEIKPLVADLHFRQNNTVGAHGDRRVRRLTAAIEAHREAVRQSDIEPEPQDLALWAVLDAD